MLNIEREIIEKRILEQCVRRPKTSLLFNGLRKEMIALGRNVNVTKRAKAIGWELKVKGLFYQDKIGGWRLSTVGYEYFMKIKDREWVPYIPEATPEILKTLSALGPNWISIVELFGKHTYAGERILSILAGQEYLEVFYKGKVITGVEVFPEPTIFNTYKRCGKLYRKPDVKSLFNCNVKIID